MRETSGGGGDEKKGVDLLNEGGGQVKMRSRKEKVSEI